MQNSDFVFMFVLAMLHQQAKSSAAVGLQQSAANTNKTAAGGSKIKENCTYRWLNANLLVWPKYPTCNCVS